MQDLYALHTTASPHLRVLAVNNPPFASRSKGKWTGLDVDLVERFAKSIKAKVKYTSASSWSAASGRPKREDYTSARHRIGFPTYDLVIGGMFTNLDPRRDHHVTAGMEASVPYVAGEPLEYANIGKASKPPEGVFAMEPRFINLVPDHLDHLLDGGWATADDLQGDSKGAAVRAVFAGALAIRTLFGEWIRSARVVRLRKSRINRVILCRIASGLAAGLSASIESDVQDGTVARLLKQHAHPSVKVGPEVTSEGVRISPERVIALTHGVLRVVGPTFLPVYDAEARCGIDVDILSRFAKALGRKPVFAKCSTQDLLTGVDEHAFDALWRQERAKSTHGTPDPRARFYSSFQADVIAGGLSFTHSRERLVSVWTAPYMSVRRALILRKGDGLRNLRDAKDDSILVRGGSFAWEDGQNRGLEKLLNDNAYAERDIFQKLLRGDVRGVLRGTIVAQAMVAAFPDLFEYIEWGDDEPLHYMCNAGSGIAAALSAFCKRLEVAGETQRIIHSNLKTAKALKLAHLNLN